MVIKKKWSREEAKKHARTAEVSYDSTNSKSVGMEWRQRPKDPWLL